MRSLIICTLCQTVKETKSRMSWTRQVARMAEMRIAYNVLIEKSEGKR